MKINVYAEHLGADRKPEIVSKVSDGVVYSGLRVYLKGEHNSVTFWEREGSGAFLDLLDDCEMAIDAWRSRELC